MAHGIKAAAEHLAAAAGLRIVPEWRMRNLPQATYLTHLFEWLDIDCVFDVGANGGQYHDFLRAHVGFSGQIISFEPNPVQLDRLRRRVGDDPHWRIVPLALGREAGRASFNVMESDQFSSFLQPHHGEVQMFVEGNRVVQRVEVEVATLADLTATLLAESGCSRPYLKLDTQGFDLPIIQGAGEALPRFMALQSEASVKPIYVGAPSFSDLIADVVGRGFEVSAVFPNNPEHFPLMVEFDCHFVRRDLVPAGVLG